MPAISKLGPVHTAGHPLIECGCREIEISLLLVGIFGINDEKSPALTKKITKKFHGNVLNSLLVGRIEADGLLLPIP